MSRRSVSAQRVLRSASGFQSPQTEAVHAKLSVGQEGVVRIFARDHQGISDPVHTAGGVLVLPATRRKTGNYLASGTQRLSTFKLGVICLVSVAATDPGGQGLTTR